MGEFCCTKMHFFHLFLKFFKTGGFDPHSVTETGYLPNLYMAGSILLFSVTDYICCSLSLRENWPKKKTEYTTTTSAENTWKQASHILDFQTFLTEIFWFKAHHVSFIEH